MDRNDPSTRRPRDAADGGRRASARTPVGARRRALRLLALAVALLGVLVWKDRGSLERGNRLLKSGRAETAKQVYRDVARQGGEPRADYNLGTVLLREDAAEAEQHLRRALSGTEPAVARRAYYNLGYSLLARAAAPTRPDSAALLLLSSVAASRAAVRLEPGDPNARWNLAVAQRRLDSLRRVAPDLRPPEEPGSEPLLSDRVDALPGTRPEGYQPNQATPTDEPGGGPPPSIRLSSRQRIDSGAEAPGGQPPRDAGSPDRGSPRPATGAVAREALAGRVPGALSAEAARRLVDAGTDDPKKLIRAILQAERPPVAWWDGEPFPGGGW